MTPNGNNPASEKYKADIYTLAEGCVTLQWPERMTAEGYEEMKESLELSLRKIKRSIVKQTTAADALLAELERTKVP